MTEDELKEIESRYAKAQPGPWSVTYGRLHTASNRVLASFAHGLADTADFIAHARSDVPALCREIRVLRASPRMLGYDPSTGLRESS